MQFSAIVVYGNCICFKTKSLFDRRNKNLELKKKLKYHFKKLNDNEIVFLYIRFIT